MDINEYRRRGECSQPSRRARNHRRGKCTDDHEGRGFLRGKHQREWLACPHAIITVGGVELCKNNINQMVTIATYKNEKSSQSPPLLPTYIIERGFVSERITVT